MRQQPKQYINNATEFSKAIEKKHKRNRKFTTKKRK